MTDSGPGAPGYTIEPKNKFAEANRLLIEAEVRPGSTVTFLAEVDLTEVERLRARPTWRRRPTYTAFVVKAVALALRDYPYANRRVWRRAWLPFGGARLQRFDACDVAIAVERDQPGSEATAFLDVIRAADRLPLSAIAESLHGLATCDATTNAQWRQFSTLIGRLPAWLAALLIRLPGAVPSWWVRYRGGAALISSPAKYGVDLVAASWPHPLGFSFGLAKPRPVVRDGAIVARPTFFLTLNFDRRVMAGAQGARFFRRVVAALEQAETDMAPYCDPPAGPGPARSTDATDRAAVGPVPAPASPS